MQASARPMGGAGGGARCTWFPRHLMSVPTAPDRPLAVVQMEPHQSLEEPLAAQCVARRSPAAAPSMLDVLDGRGAAVAAGLVLDHDEPRVARYPAHPPLAGHVPP